MDPVCVMRRLSLKKKYLEARRSRTFFRRDSGEETIRVYLMLMDQIFRKMVNDISWWWSKVSNWECCWLAAARYDMFARECTLLPFRSRRCVRLACQQRERVMILSYLISDKISVPVAFAWTFSLRRFTSPHGCRAWQGLAGLVSCHRYICTVLILRFLKESIWI